ncbi:hypothetical protein LP416_24945 [Polaromonas sp. P2-4]|nr:hypothetical protein LP416_24945 [Polaromonas sp. P2-4]
MDTSLNRAFALKRSQHSSHDGCDVFGPGVVGFGGRVRGGHSLVDE